MASKYLNIHQFFGDLLVKMRDGGNKKKWVGTQRRTLSLGDCGLAQGETE